VSSGPRAVTEFLNEGLLPNLIDKCWLVLNGRTIAKIQDESLMGIDLKTTRGDASIVSIKVFLRPLYWPLRGSLYGLVDDLSAWGEKQVSWDLRKGKSAGRALESVTMSVNTQLAPAFSQWATARAILEYRKRHPFDPLLGSARMLWGRSDSPPGVLGYLAAWAGDVRASSGWLRRELSYLRSDPEPGEYGEHIEHTLSLLGRPRELRDFLSDTARATRADLGLPSS